MTEITTSDTLSMRLIAYNPLTIPVQFRLACGDPGLWFHVYNQGGRVREGLFACRAVLGANVVRVAAGDSLIRHVRWSPRYYVGSLEYAYRPPGAYAVAAVIEAEGSLKAVSEPVAFQLRLP